MGTYKVTQVVDRNCITSLSVCPISKRHMRGGICFETKGLPIVLKVNDEVSMKSIDMYIVHESSSVVCFSATYKCLICRGNVEIIK